MSSKNNPYRMNPNNVTPTHFKDARIYDYQINEPGWQIQSKQSKKKYRNWVNNIRQEPGWDNFRKAIIIDDDDENQSLSDDHQ